MKDKSKFKVIACLSAEDLTRIRTRTINEKFHWDRISFPMDRFHTFPYGSYLAYVNYLGQESQAVENDISTIRQSEYDFPIFLVTETNSLEKGLQLLNGTWDALVPKVPGWEQRLEKELAKLAEVRDRESIYEEGGCLLAMEMSMRNYNQRILEHYLSKYDGSVYEVARRLDMGKSTIYRMLKERMTTH